MRGRVARDARADRGHIRERSPERLSPPRAILLVHALHLLTAEERAAPGFRAHRAFAAVWYSLPPAVSAVITRYWSQQEGLLTVPDIWLVDYLARGVADYQPALAHFQSPAIIRVDAQFARLGRAADLRYVLAHELGHAFADARGLKMADYAEEAFANLMAAAWGHPESPDFSQAVREIFAGERDVISRTTASIMSAPIKRSA